MKLWIDTDCGVDDSTALLICLSSPNVEIIGISCIGGNVSCDQVTLNVRRTLKAYGKENIPVYKGCERGLIADSMHIPEIHGKDGLGDIDLDAFGVRDVVPIQKENAIFKLIDVLKENNDIEILTLGPLTNLAIALQICPEIEKNIKRLTIMGGAEDLKGNTTKFAEFNIYCDPEAAAIVFREVQPSKIYLATWTLTVHHIVTGDDFTSIFLQKDTYMQRWIGATWHLPIEHDSGNALMADPLAAFVCVSPEYIKEDKRATIEVPLSGEQRGATVSKDDPNGAHIVQKIDLSKFFENINKLLQHH